MLLVALLSCYRPLPSVDDDTGVDGTGTDSVPTDTDTDSGTTYPTGSTPFLDPGVTLGDPVPCDDPLPEVRYTEVGAEAGFLGETDPDTGTTQSGGAIAIDDFDLDGDLDIVVSYYYDRTTDHTMYLQSEDGPAAPWTPRVYTGLTQGAGYSLADIDGDGRRDLLAAAPPALFRVTDEGLETLPTPELPAGTEPIHVRDLAPADVDGDGDIDLYVAFNGDDDEEGTLRRDVLWRGAGDGSFELEEDAFPLDEATGKAFDAMFFDADGDGDQDAYISNDVGGLFGENQLFENRDGSFYSTDGGYGSEVAITGMGVDIADENGDGAPDLYLTAGKTSVLLRSYSGQWVDTTTVASAAYPEMGWGAIFLDYDNDRLQDVLVALGPILRDGDDNGAGGDGLGLLHRKADETFEDVMGPLDLDPSGNYRSVAAVDLNRDGVLDLFGMEVQARPRLYLSDGCTAAGWLQVEAPSGSVVTLHTDAGRQVDWVTTESGRGAAIPPFVHFGLGEDQTFNYLTVTLPDGRELVAGGPWPARRVVTVTP